MTINIPPINVIGLLQSNILQTMFAVTLAVIIGLSQKGLSRIILITIAAFGPAFFTIGILLNLVQSQSVNIIAAFVFSVIGTWVVAKGDITTSVKK